MSGGQFIHTRLFPQFGTSNANDRPRMLRHGNARARTCVRTLRTRVSYARVARARAHICTFLRVYNTRTLMQMYRMNRR